LQNSQNGVSVKIDIAIGMAIRTGIAIAFTFGIRIKHQTLV
jgi:hypothetical protein